jgi:hypothetical protein
LQATYGQVAGSGRAAGWQVSGNIWQLRGNRLDIKSTVFISFSHVLCAFPGFERSPAIEKLAGETHIAIIFVFVKPVAGGVGRFEPRPDPETLVTCSVAGVVHPVSRSMERIAHVPRPTRIPRALVALMAAIAVAPSTSMAVAAPRESAASGLGAWQERDMKTRFDVRPGPTPKQIFVVIPKDVTFPGSHQFLLTKGADGAYGSAERNRPKVSLVFDGSAKARLSVRGSGATASGSWIAMNDFILVRP